MDSFNNFNLLDSIKAAIPTQALQGMQDLVPTPVQKIAIPRLLGDKGSKRRKDTTREEFLIAAETGSGKTLSYVLPMINAVKLAEQGKMKPTGKQEEAAYDRAYHIKARGVLHERAPLIVDGAGV